MYKVLPLIVVIDLACLGLAPFLRQLAQLVLGTPAQIVVIYLMILGSRFFLMGTFADYVYYRFCLSELAKQRDGQSHSRRGVSLLSALSVGGVIVAWVLMSGRY